jgi:ABC-type transport system involved in cytochrome c biogenesis permease subunit
MIAKSSSLAWIVVAGIGMFSAAYVLMAAIPPAPRENTFDLQTAGRIPVLDHGRIKPMDSLARVSLLVISGRTEFTHWSGDLPIGLTPDKEAVLIKNEKFKWDKPTSAMEWLMDVLTVKYRSTQNQGLSIPGRSADMRGYRILNTDTKKELNLPAAKSEFSYRELVQGIGTEEKLEEVINQWIKLDADSPDEATRERAMVAAQIAGHRNFSKYETPYRVFRIDNKEVLDLLMLPDRPGSLRYGFDEVLPRLAHLSRESERVRGVNTRNRNAYDNKVLEVGEHVELYIRLGEGNARTLHLVGPDFPGDEFKTLPQVIARIDRNNPRAIEDLPATKEFLTILLSYARQKDHEVFNKAVTDYLAHLKKVEQPNSETVRMVSTASMEASFNHFAPFYQCAVLYLIIFLVSVLSWLWPDRVLIKFAFWMTVATVLLHSWALIMRMYIQGRPPVTNLYSSAVFIGWACVLFCVFVELKARNAMATAVAAMCGFSTLLIAHYLGGSGDTLEMMQAVLDTNFWLATHVTSVTIGYSATFVAGAFGIVFLWMMLVTTVLNSLRQGGPLSVSGAGLFFVAAFFAALIVFGLAMGMLYGMYYLPTRESPPRVFSMVLGYLTLGGALGVAIWLLRHRAAAVGQEKPTALPQGTEFLEPLALNDENRKVLTWMMYGTVCFAMLFSFVGTVLGGIWADVSWGRFWGWDPKENGALLIVIWNALILHARWGGMVKERGIAILALVGNMITMWSWFGTNQLGIGLHAYGFNNALVTLCTVFWMSQLLLIGVALLPFPNWRNYSPLPKVIPITIEQTLKRAPIKGRRGHEGTQPA